MMRSTHLAAVAALTVLALSCAASSHNAAAANTEEADYGKLELLNVTTTPLVDAITFRGSFRNPFNEATDGIRIVLRIAQEPGENAPTLVREQKVLDTHLEPGEHTPFEITAKVRPQSLANAGLYLHGFAVRRGGQELPVSPLWGE